MKFFVWLNEQQQGPFDEEAIQKMVSDGQITHETLLCPESGGVDWTPAKDLFPQDASLESVVLSNSSNDAKTVEEKIVERPVEDNSDTNSLVEIRLHSGTELKIKAVRLYDETALGQLNSKKAEAAKLFQGVSTGLGSIGSIGWVAAASLVIGAAEAALSAGASSAGVKLLEETIRAERKLRNEGVFLSIGKIQHIESPMPGLWRVPVTKNFEVTVPLPFDGIFGKNKGLTKIETKTISSAFVHNGDEFIIVQTDSGSTCSIRWSSVEHYAYLPNVK
jgi:hypothetical protein